MWRVRRTRPVQSASTETITYYKKDIHVNLQMIPQLSVARSQENTTDQALWV